MKSSELPFIRAMFENIAPRYDFLNRFLSLRQDVVWRRALVGALALPSGARVLDTACGTADIGLEIVRATAGAVHVTGIDFAVEMLRKARPKIVRRQALAAIHLAAADAFALPFRPAGFDAVTMAFGIRNIQAKTELMRHFHGLLKPGGQMAVLELAMPTQGWLQKLFLVYFNRLLPLAGRFFSKHHFAYTYLPSSVAGFPKADRFAGMMRQAGFLDIRYRKLTGGIAVLFIGRKPQAVESRKKESRAEHSNFVI